MRLIVSSDWHLDWTTAGVPRVHDVKAAIATVVEKCLRGDMFLFLGDLSDPESIRVHHAIGIAATIAEKLKSKGVFQTWIPGNHDVVEDGFGSSTLSALDAFGVLQSSPKVEFIDGLSIVSLPFTPRTLAYDPEEFITGIGAASVVDPDRVVVIGHLNIEGIGPGSETTDMPRGRSVFLPVDAIRKQWPKAVILNGHYHRQQLFNGVHIPGSLCRLMFSEEHNEPGFLIVEV